MQTVREDTGTWAETAGDHEEPAALLPAELLHIAEELCTSYVPARVTVDSHAEEFFREHKRKVCSGDRIFAEQILYGCTRYKKFLEAFLSAFYYKERCAQISVRCTAASMQS